MSRPALALLLTCLGCAAPSPQVLLEDGGLGDGGALAGCGALGSSCSTSCPDGLTCTNSVCVPSRADCGGFVGKPCEDATTSCLSYQGADYGTCATNAEQACLCKRAPGSFSGCK